MGRFGLFAVAAAGLVMMLAGCCASSQTDARLAELEKSQRKLLARLAKEQNDDAIPLNEIFELYMDRGGISPVLLQKYLNRIQLPPSPGEQQITEYLEKLYALRSVNWNSDRQQEVIVAKIVAAGRDGLPLMFRYTDANSFQSAIQRLLTTQDKGLLLENMAIGGKDSKRGNFAAGLFAQMAEPSDCNEVLANLGRYTHLIRAVIRLGLEKRAVGIIVEDMMNPSGNFDFNSDCVRVAMTHLDGKDKQNFMERYWLIQLRIHGHGGHPGNAFEVALQLAQNGYVPAFEFLAKNAPSFRTDHRSGQLLLLGGFSDVDQMLEWYMKNRGKITYDAEKRRFVADGDPVK